MRQFLRYLGVLMGMILICVSLFQIVQWQLRIQGTENVQANYSGVIRENISSPSEKSPKEKFFTVDSSSPRKIILPSLNQEGLIQKVGLTKDHEISVPTNIHLAGWFNGTVKPGDNGLSVITGHVRGRYRDGIFHNLDQLHPGDIIHVEYGDGRKVDFVVMKKKHLPVGKTIDSLLTQHQNLSSQLNLITCSGDFQEDIGTYENRLLVVTKPL